MVKNSTRSMEVIKPCNSRRDDCTLLLCRSTEVSVSKGIVTHIGPFELVRISLDNNRQVTQKPQKSFSRHVMEKKVLYLTNFDMSSTSSFPFHILLALSWESINQRKSCRRRGTFLGQSFERAATIMTFCDP